MSDSSVVFDTALAAAGEAARRRARLGELVREIEKRAADGRATPDNARRYRLARLAQSMLSSPGGLPHVPSSVDAILATRHGLEAERIFGHGVPGPALT